MPDAVHECGEVPGARCSLNKSRCRAYSSVRDRGLCAFRVSNLHDLVNRLFLPNSSNIFARRLSIKPLTLRVSPGLRIVYGVLRTLLLASSLALNSEACPGRQGFLRSTCTGQTCRHSEQGLQSLRWRTKKRTKRGETLKSHVHVMLMQLLSVCAR